MAAVVPEREREHAVESLARTRHAPFDDRVQHHLGVAGGDEPVAPLLQAVAETGEVVDLAVVDEGRSGELHRLVGTRVRVHDREACHRERAGRHDDRSGGVGPTVPEGEEDRIQLRPQPARGRDDAAHVVPYPATPRTTSAACPAMER